MGCRWCNYTGWMREHEEEAGWVDIPCPWCVGVDGEEPDIVTEGHDALTEMEMESEAEEELEGGP